MTQDPQPPGDTPPPSGRQPGPEQQPGQPSPEQQPGQPGPSEPPPAYPPPPTGEYPPPASPGYGQEYATAPYPYYGAPAAPPTDDKAVWALVTSIAGWIICPIILHIVGWVLANQSLATIRASGGTVGGEGMAKAARILSIVGLVLYGVLILFFLLLGLVGLIAAVDSGEFAQTLAVV
jgi:hypothetical protein